MCATCNSVHQQIMPRFYKSPADASGNHQLGHIQDHVCLATSRTRSTAPRCSASEHDENPKQKAKCSLNLYASWLFPKYLVFSDQIV